MSLVRHINFEAADRVALKARKPAGGEIYKHSETTRLLSAAAYLNRSFRDQVIKICLEEKHRALGPSFGVDLGTVVRHCRSAKHKLDLRELWLLAPFAVALFVVLNVLQAPNPASLFLDIEILFAVYFVAFCICLWFEFWARSIVTRNFLRGKFDPDGSLRNDKTPTQRIDAAETGNVVIYSGFSPFVGSGEDMAGWSFAVDLRKTDAKLGGAARRHSSAPEAVTLEALYTRVADDIESLRLDRVTIEDRLYVNGRDIRDDKRFLDDPLCPPRNEVSPSVMTRAMLEQSEKHLRHYRCIRVVDWSGELVLSIFLRFSKLSHNLFVEASYFLLIPVSEWSRKVDSLSPYFNLRRFTRTLVSTTFSTPFLTVFAPFTLLNRLLHPIHHWLSHREEKKQILDNPSFDYGASFSVRQWTSGREYRRYFQKLDKEMYFKVLEKNILDSIITFLEENGVDVSELKQRQSTILNNGVIVSGGNMSAENLSVGANAKVENVLTQKLSRLTTVVTGGKPAAK